MKEPSSAFTLFLTHVVDWATPNEPPGLEGMVTWPRANAITIGRIWTPLLAFQDVAAASTVPPHSPIIRNHTVEVDLRWSLCCCPVCDGGPALHELPPRCHMDHRLRQRYSGQADLGQPQLLSFALRDCKILRPMSSCRRAPAWTACLIKSLHFKTLRRCTFSRLPSRMWRKSRAP